MRRQRVWLLYLIVGGLCAGAAQAGFWEDFKKARDAVEAKSYDEAEKLIRQAISDNPEPKRRIRGRYIPYYYLGVILQEKGDCPGAMEAWATSDRYDVVKADSEESKDKVRRKLRCEKAAAELDKASSEVGRALNTTRSTLERLDQRKKQAAVAAAWQQGSPSPAQRRDEAATRLRKAEGLAAEATRLRDPDRLRRVAREADAVTVILEELFDETEVLLNQAGEAQAAASEALADAVESARSALRRVASLAPYPDGLGRRVATLQRRIGAAENVADEAAALQEARRELESATRALEGAAKPPPARLIEAAELYLSQDFTAVIADLEAWEPTEDRVRYHAALLRAASHFQLHHGSPDPDELHLAAAREAVKVCLLIDPAADMGHPSPSYYPPAFLELFSAVQNELAAADDDGAARLEDRDP